MASGVFYYFLEEQVKALIKKLASAFPKGRLVFDAANKKASRLLRKPWLKVSGMKNVGAYFALFDAEEEISPWSEKIEVSHRGYMLGYNDLKDSSVSPFFRLLARLGDDFMKMQIVKIDFKEDL